MPSRDKIMMQEVQVLRQMGRHEEALKRAAEAVNIFSTNHKLWLIKSQIQEQLGDVEGVRLTFEDALMVPEMRKCALVWINAADFEIRQQYYTKARTLLQKARIKIADAKSCVDIWFHSIRLEVLSDNVQIARNLCSQALQKYPESGRIWAESIALEPLKTRKTQAMNALKTIEDSPWVFLEISKYFWQEFKPQKAIKFVRQALSFDKDNGDAWLFLYKYVQDDLSEEILRNKDQLLAKILNDFQEADVSHGYLWPKYMKRVENWGKPKRTLLHSLSAQTSYN